MTKIYDGLRNLVANLGTGRDKAAATTYTTPAIDPGTLVAMYRSSAIARRIVDMPAEDAIRQWRDWQAMPEQISAIEAEEDRLGIAQKLDQAGKLARLRGGCAVLIGTSEQDLSKPLVPDRIKIGGINYLSIIGRDELSIKRMENDPREDYYGGPGMYSLNVSGAHMEIHPSRLIVLQGNKHLDERFAGVDQGWSDSVLVSAISAVTNMDATMANIASLVFEAKVDVVKIPNLMQNLKKEGAAYEKLVLSRATLSQTGKGINGTLLMDAEEDYEQKNANFSGLPAIVDRFMHMTSAASGIPMTLLFGTSPGGLNSTGESDARAYYDRVRVTQRLSYQPAMAVFDECLIRSALGSRPDEIHYSWTPLWQVTAKERADTGKTTIDAFKAMSDIGNLPDEAVAEAMVNAVTESGFAPGLEAAVAGQYGEGDEDGGDESLIGEPE